MTGVEPSVGNDVKAQRIRASKALPLVDIGWDC